jgi:hypothetical protein
MLDFFGVQGTPPPGAPRPLCGGEPRAGADHRRAAAPWPPVDTPPTLDVKALADLSGLLGLPAVRALAAELFSDGSGAWADLVDALQRRDTAAVSTCAHRFKGAAHLMGMAWLAERAEAVHAHAGRWTDDDADAAIVSLRMAWQASHTLCRRLGLLEPDGRG